VPIATYQGKVFQVSSRKLYTLAGFSLSGEIDTEAQEKVGDKPSTYIKGLGLDTISFQIPLSISFGHKIRAEIEFWQNVRDKRKPDVLLLGSKPVGKYKWLLKSVSVTGTEIDGRGELIKATIELQLEEYVRAGRKKEESSSKTIALGQTLIPDVVFPPVSSSTELGDLKRTNPNALQALSQF